MKKSVPFILASLVLTLSACRTLSESAKAFTKQTGIPVNLQTTDDDSCAAEQFAKFERQVPMTLFGSKKLDAVKKALSRYQSITIEPTKVTETTSGSRISLILGHMQTQVLSQCTLPGNVSVGATCANLDEVKRKQCVCKITTSQSFVEDRGKILEDTIATTGTSPQTLITKGDVLTIQSEASEDDSEISVYRTLLPELFDLLNGAQNSDWNEGLRIGAITLESSYSGPQNSCADRVSLEDLY